MNLNLLNVEAALNNVAWPDCTANCKVIKGGDIGECWTRCPWKFFRPKELKENPYPNCRILCLMFAKFKDDCMCELLCPGKKT